MLRSRNKATPLKYNTNFKYIIFEGYFCNIFRGKPALIKHTNTLKTAPSSFTVNCVYSHHLSLWGTYSYLMILKN